MSDPALLADHIGQRVDEILAVWRITVSREGDVPEAERLSYAEFIDHVPELLDLLAERLRGRPADTVSESQKHGRLRWKQGYDIAEVVNEFGHLRTALLRATTDYARDRAWAVHQFEEMTEVINEVIDESVAESVRQFQEDSRRETQAALAEARTRQAAIEDAWIAAKTEQAKLRTVLRNLPAAVWVVDAEGMIIGINTEAERLHGAVLDHAAEPINVGQLATGHVVFRPDGSPCTADELPLIRALGGETVSQEEYLWCRGDERTSVLVNASPLTDAGGTLLGAVGVAQDITSRKRLEHTLDQQRRVAEEASRHKTRLVSALSHDARTPLNAVVLAAQLLDVHVGQLPEPEVQECLRTIRHSVKNVLDLLNDLLDLSKIDAGAAPTELSRFSVASAMAESFAAIENQARGKGLDVRFEPGPLADVTLETDRSKLKQMLGNLLSNALRYTERGHIRLFGERTADQVRIGVEDTGLGIAPEDQGRIFEEFARIDDPRRRPGEGTGLGLAICRRLASLLGGEITLRSAPGVGSTFTIVLPATFVTDRQTAAEQVTPAGTPATGAILVAEDHQDSRQTLSKVLRRMGYRVLEASDGQEALLLARGEEHLLAVLMDVNMPQMDGIEATSLLRADPKLKDVPIFALTGDVTPDNRHRIGEAGVNGYLEKPVSLSELKQALGALRERPES